MNEIGSGWENVCCPSVCIHFFGATVWNKKKEVGVEFGEKEMGHSASIFERRILAEYAASD